MFLFVFARHVLKLPSPSSSGALTEDGPWLWRSGITFSL
ncbi:hypothetical protein Taro_015933 [Colocasia esculenta]|uniref:Uncharacterized protein n=1 Tax=Colocasia esculenta TaxID=4460 RepID=A0A843UCM4_COLES|nr:hypothetical protein [Colocasia esculenta]